MSDQDLNDIVTKAVSAKIDAAVLAALSGNDTMGRYITAALQRQIEVPDGSGYGKKREPFLHNVVSTAIQKAAVDALHGVVDEMRPQLIEQVRKELRRQLPALTEALVATGMESMKAAYRTKVAVSFEPIARD